MKKALVWMFLVCTCWLYQPLHGQGIIGTAFYDANNNGVKDSGEPGIAGFQVTLTFGDTSTSTLTDSLGQYSFLSLTSGEYTVCQMLYPGLGLTPTTPLCWEGFLGGFIQVNFGYSDQCINNMVTNSSFQTGLMPSWEVGYGSPIPIGAEGCDDSGYVRLYGSKGSGSAIYQVLSGPAIEKGKLYELKMCARLAPGSPVDYAKIRVVAFNNSLTPDEGGNHPPPTADLAIIDVSGKINCSDWSTNTLHRWKANKDFSSIAISVENNHQFLQSIADIDNICFVEVGDTIPCYAANMDTLGNITIPFGQIDPACPPWEDSLDMFMGSVQDLYGGLCDDAAAGVDTWYSNPGCPDSCASVGGELPPELTDFILNDSLSYYLAEEGFPDLVQFFGKTDSLFDILEDSVGDIRDTLLGLGALPPLCDPLPPIYPPQGDSTRFAGRDIVFVHGYRLNTLGDRIDGEAGALTRWPSDKNEFITPSGYWKAGANQYWQDHIKQYWNIDADGTNQSGTKYSNRFLVVAHPSPQSGIIAVHAILWQITNAIKNGTGVIKCNPNDLRPLNTFGQNGIIIISHSAGMLFSNVSMSIADLTQTDPLLNSRLGDLSYLVEAVHLHIALQGAQAGSGWAPALLVAATVPPMHGMVKKALGSVNAPSQSDLPWLYTSQTLDMTIPQTIYGDIGMALFGRHLIRDVPMNVLTVAGGSSHGYGIARENPADHSNFSRLFAKHVLHLGFDDGVLSLDGQAGNSDRRRYFPNRYFPKLGVMSAVSPLLNNLIYDMGIKRLDGGSARANSYYLDQKLDIATSTMLGPPALKYFASAGAIPSLSPTGMVQPVSIGDIPGVPGYDALKRYESPASVTGKKHYSFIQSSAEHFSGSTYLHNPDYAPVQFPNYQSSKGIRNSEEVRVITDASIYEIVSPTMKNLQTRYTREKRIGGWCLLKWGGKCRVRVPSLRVWFRQYDLLRGNCGSDVWSPDCDEWHQLDYVYKYVLPQ